MTLAVIPTRWDRVADVVVVGGGNAGLPAAIVAHDSGADTVIVESNEFLGGQIIYDNGQVANPNLSEYALAGRVDMPVDLQISLLENRFDGDSWPRGDVPAAGIAGYRERDRRRDRDSLLAAADDG